MTNLHSFCNTARWSKSREYTPATSRTTLSPAILDVFLVISHIRTISPNMVGQFLARNLITWLNSFAASKLLSVGKFLVLDFGEIVVLKMALDNEQYLRQLQREYLDFLDDDVSEFLNCFRWNRTLSWVGTCTSYFHILAFVDEYISSIQLLLLNSLIPFSLVVLFFIRY